MATRNQWYEDASPSDQRAHDAAMEKVERAVRKYGADSVAAVYNRLAEPETRATGADIVETLRASDMYTLSILVPDLRGL